MKDLQESVRGVEVHEFGARLVRRIAAVQAEEPSQRGRQLLERLSAQLRLVHLLLYARVPSRTPETAAQVV